MEFNKAFPYGINQSERVIEIPWALSKYNGGERVLEVGCSFADDNPWYIAELKNLGVRELHGIDCSDKPAPSFIKKTADIRDSGYESDFFDMVLCISTIEHIGMDNKKHYRPVAEISTQHPDIDALSEMYRITKTGGKIAITVPYGDYVDYGWFKHYDKKMFTELVESVDCSSLLIEYFKYTKDGWIQCEARDLVGVTYASNGASYASGLCCCIIQK